MWLRDFGILVPITCIKSSTFVTTLFPYECYGDLPKSNCVAGGDLCRSFVNFHALRNRGTVRNRDEYLQPTY